MSNYTPIQPIDLRTTHPEFKGAWHLVYYIPSRCKTESFSRSIIAFKDGEKSDVNLWARILVNNILSLNIEFDYVIRALGSTELAVIERTNPLDRVGTLLEQSIKGNYCPELIYKTREVPPIHTLKSSHKRNKALEGVYCLGEDSPNLNGVNLLIIDDIVTSGYTLDHIRKAIMEVYPRANIFFFTLAQTAPRVDYDNYDTRINDKFDPRQLK